MPGVKIEVKLPKDRASTGTLSIKDEDGKVLLADIQVLGKADSKTASKKNNASMDSTKPYGHTPLGSYSVTQIFSTGSGTVYDANQYGPNGAVRLEPTAGDALVAKINGRTGLLIHGGRDKRNGKLTPTNGCLRVADEDIKRIISAIVQASQNAAQNRCEILEISIGVGKANPDEDLDAGDPPPTAPAPVILP